MQNKRELIGNLNNITRDFSKLDFEQFTANADSLLAMPFQALVMLDHVNQQLAGVDAPALLSKLDTVLQEVADATKDEKLNDIATDTTEVLREAIKLTREVNKLPLKDLGDSSIPLLTNLNSVTRELQMALKTLDVKQLSDDVSTTLNALAPLLNDILGLTDHADVLLVDARTLTKELNKVDILDIGNSIAVLLNTLNDVTRGLAGLEKIDIDQVNDLVKSVSELSRAAKHSVNAITVAACLALFSITARIVMGTKRPFTQPETSYQRVRTGDAKTV